MQVRASAVGAKVTIPNKFGRVGNTNCHILTHTHWGSHMHAHTHTDRGWAREVQISKDRHKFFNLVIFWVSIIILGTNS